MQTIHICFPEGKHKVLTFSYDDGRGADKKLVEIFNKYGMKGTFHLNSGFINPNNKTRTFHHDYIQAYEVAKLYHGHEIACHTVTHPTIARTPIEHVTLQVMEDRRFLEKITGYPVQGFSYPNGSYNEEIKQMLPHTGIEYARIVGSSAQFAMPNDYYQWQATCHHNHRLLELGEAFKSLNKAQYLYMMSVWGHSYEFDHDDNWHLIEQFCANMSSQSDIWYATNIEMVRYMKAANQLVLGIDANVAYNPTAIPLWISINGEIKRIPPGETIAIKPSKQIVLIGDSTVQSYHDQAEPKAGWGQYIDDYFSAQLQFANYAIGGRSAKSFIEEGRLAQLDEAISKADYVFIQMGHNDANRAKPERYSNPNTEFKGYLKKYIAFAREREAVPFLITPVPTFTKENGHYKNNFQAYCQAIKAVAEEEKVHCIDLMNAAIHYYQQLDDDQVKRFYLLALGYDDRTHFTKEGARVIASLLAQELKQRDPIFLNESLI
ncbi:SGNH/GDSL hydrolase family protein [Amphibacillus sediminis]|uniref:SGNH/GDSL hydrolase family protein n=1 Tax=Amphibacillus sediminis TaxID=360185 RepID=UPI000A8B5704|nr:SGNH/GDSL hydrolase family protein [Amphibacillus sediminis]